MVSGGSLSVALNIAMVEAFSLEPLAWYVIPLAMVALWTVGQAAVAGPAKKASNITPAIATRASTAPATVNSVAVTLPHAKYSDSQCD